MENSRIINKEVLNKNKKIKKIPAGYIIISVIVIILAFILWFISLFKFPAKKYVNASMKAICFDETDEYEKLTKCSKEEIDDAIDSDLTIQAEAFAAYFGITDISDKSMEMLKNFSKKVYTYSKYKVTKQKKNKDGFIVTVKVKPILFSEISQEKVNEYIKEFNQKAEDGQYIYDSDAIYQEAFLEGLISIYEKELKSVEYGSYQKVKVNINKVSNKQYSADLTEALNKIVCFD